MVKAKMQIYFGHPTAFWRERHRSEMAVKVDLAECDKLCDIVNYDAVHLEKLIVNQASRKLENLLNEEDAQLDQRRVRLKAFLEAEEEQLFRELETKQAIQERAPCIEREVREKKYEEDLQREKIMKCQMALERQKIAKGIKWTKEEECRLREMQKIQMTEKKYKEEREKEIERLWHDVLINDVRNKELQERLQERRRQQEMSERRRQYDEQIASAHARRSEAIRAERDKENRRLENMKKKMEIDHAEALKKKKEQQQQNRLNYIEGHEERLLRLQQERRKDRSIDDATIRAALEELRREQDRQRIQMQQLQQEKQVFMAHYNRERRTASSLEQEADKFAQHWKQAEEERADECTRRAETEKQTAREKAAQEYRIHLEDQKLAMERERQERVEGAWRVRAGATRELRRKLNDACAEQRRQADYRDSLTHQLEDNMRAMENERYYNDSRLQPFIKRPATFEDMMESKMDKSPGRTSTNPVHPFRRVMESKHATCLPSLTETGGRTFK